MCYIVKKKGKGTTQEKKIKKIKGSHLEKKDSQERELCVEKRIKRRKQSVAVFEKDN